MDNHSFKLNDSVLGKTLLKVLLCIAFSATLHGSTEIVNGVEWDYTVWSSGATVNGVVGGASGAIDIPSSLGGVPVTEIHWNAFDGCAGLTSVTIPNGVTSIGSGAFEDCTGLKSIVIPGSVAEIGWYAFQGCAGLKSATLETGVRKIGNGAFANCTGLTSLSLPPSVTEIGGDAFAGCTALSSITIPNGFTSIGDCSFRNCSGLKSISIPNGVTSIGNGAFDGCSSLVSVSIPSGVTRLGNNAFARCSSLVLISIPSGVTSIDYSAFYDCSSLMSISIPSTVTSIGTSAFGCCSALKSLTIPDSVTSVGMHAFFWCDGLKSLTIPMRFKGKTSDWAIPRGCTVYYILTPGSSYSVAFNANGGKLPRGKKMAKQTMTYGKSAKLRKNEFIRSGYVFAGWAMSKSGTVAYGNAQSVKNISGRSGTTTLYAKWAKNNYKVAFYANGGKGKMAAQTMTYGKATRLSANKFKRGGYVFQGWAKSKTGKVVYKNKTAVKNLVMNGKTVKLYAKWKKK